MTQSMTGFGSKEAQIAPFGKVNVELRTSNHKFLEIVFHLPDGFLSLEDRIKKEIERKLKRGRVICAINISGSSSSRVFINRPLLKSYVSTLRNIKREFKMKDETGMNTLIHLPGILSLEENKISKDAIWPKLKVLIDQALNALVSGRGKEGQALGVFLRKESLSLKSDIEMAKKRFRSALKKKLSAICSDEERAAFLKNSDVTEEIERLEFHVRNFQNKLSKSGPVGKEMDFIAQELQREANTLAAKSFDTAVSGRVVGIKSRIEKIREQVQNIE